MGLPEFSNASLPACHGLRTPADLHTLAFPGALVLPSVHVKTLGVRNYSFRSCTSTSGCASPLRPTGCSVYASPVLFTAFQRLRHRRKTRYGWVASPYPTGTSTPQEAPSLSRRDNDQAHRRAAFGASGEAPCWAKAALTECMQALGPPDSLRAPEGSSAAAFSTTQSMLGSISFGL